MAAYGKMCVSNSQLAQFKQQIKGDNTVFEKQIMDTTRENGLRKKQKPMGNGFPAKVARVLANFFRFPSRPVPVVVRERAIEDQLEARAPHQSAGSVKDLFP